MQFIQALAVLAFAATSLAAPTVEMVEKRTDDPQKGLGCGTQNVGELKCCEQKPVAKPIAQTGIAPQLQGLLGVVLGVVPQVIPVVQPNVQCVAIVAQIQACNNVKVCCIPQGSFGGAGAASPATQSGLITLLSGNNILSNNQFAICPAVTV